jgi:hypothetical protein
MKRSATNAAALTGRRALRKIVDVGRSQADDEESQNRQHNVRDEARRMAGLVHLVVFGKG